jgi:hypothetical protein
VKHRLSEVCVAGLLLLLASGPGCNPERSKTEPEVVAKKEALSYVPCAKGPGASLFLPPPNVTPPTLPGAVAGKPPRPDPLCPSTPPASTLTSAQLAKQQAYLAAWKAQAASWSALSPEQQEKNRASLKQQYLK